MSFGKWGVSRFGLISAATLTPGGPFVGVGAMSTGGSGETLIYSEDAGLWLTTTAPAEPCLTLLDNNALGNGFDTLKFVRAWDAERPLTELSLPSNRRRQILEPSSLSDLILSCRVRS